MFEDEGTGFENFKDQSKIVETRAQIDTATKHEFYENGVSEHEIIELKREPNRGYPGTDSGFEQIKMSELSTHLMDSLRKAGHNGTIVETTKHWAGELEGILDDKLLSNFRRVTKEIYNNRFDDALVDKGRREILEMVGQMRTVRRSK